MKKYLTLKRSLSLSLSLSLSKTTISQNVDGLEGRSEQKIDIKMLSSRSIAAVDVTFSINV